MKVQTEPAGFAGVPFGPAGKRKLEIRQVWAQNVEQEFALIRHAAEYFPYVSMDTEFPGIVHNPYPTKHHTHLTPAENYAALKANVDALHLIQVGLAFAASPTCPPAFAFQINLKEFDPAVHRHAPESIALLRDHGLDFAAHRAHGVDARVFAALLMSSGLVCAGNAVTWVTFSSAYDFGYLVKLLMGRPLPKTLPEFLGLVRVFFGDEVYDVKHVVRSLPDLPRGLDKLAAELGVVRAAGMAHQAGSDSALTWDTFRRMREVYFAKESLRRFAGVVHSLEPHLDLVAASPGSYGNGSSNEKSNDKSGSGNGYGGSGNKVGYMATGYNKVAGSNGGHGSGNRVGYMATGYNKVGSNGYMATGYNKVGSNGNGHGRRNRRKVSPVAMAALS